MKNCLRNYIYPCAIFPHASEGDDHPVLTFDVPKGLPNKEQDYCVNSRESSPLSVFSHIGNRGRR